MPVNYGYNYSSIPKPTWKTMDGACRKAWYRRNEREIALGRRPLRKP